MPVSRTLNPFGATSDSSAAAALEKDGREDMSDTKTTETSPGCCGGWKRAWKMGWKVLVCLVLLGWIFHAIFLNEAKALARQRGVDWNSLPRAEQWQQAWTHGPHELWAQLTLVHKGALLASLGLMAMTIVLGVVRWRMVLRV